MPVPPGHADAAAVDQRRSSRRRSTRIASVELDAFIVATDPRAGRPPRGRTGREAGCRPRRYAINLTPSSLLDPAFEAQALAPHGPRRRACARARSRSSAPSSSRSPTSSRSSAGSRRCAGSGFGFAVDDAGAGYASFSLIAALRPSVIKIDRDIVDGIGRDDAKQALVEAFVSFGRRIGAQLLAEGIERRADLAMLTSLGVELGQGYLLGRPALEPKPPRPMAEIRPDHARQRSPAGFAIRARSSAAHAAVAK